jgi:hypothetical protein
VVLFRFYIIVKALKGVLYEYSTRSVVERTIQHEAKPSAVLLTPCAIAWVGHRYRF